MLFWWFAASQLSLSSLTVALRAGIGIGRLTAGPLLRFAGRKLWKRRQTLKPSIQASPHIYVVTQDCEYMLVTLTRKRWRKQLAFVGKDSSITIKTCELLRSDEGVLTWNEQVTASIHKKSTNCQPDSLVVSIQSGIVCLNANSVFLYSLGRKCKDITITKKQTPSVPFNASCCAVHLGHDSLAAIGYRTQSLALFRNRHNTWSVINTALLDVTINSCLVRLADSLYRIGGRDYDSGDLTSNVWALEMPPENLPLGIRLTEFQTAKWKLMAKLPIACEKMGVIAFVRAFGIVGGIDAEGKVLNTVQLYNPAEDEWILGPPLRVPRFSPSVIRMGNYIVVLNGYGLDGKTVRTVEAIHVRYLVDSLKENSPTLGDGEESSENELHYPDATPDDNPWVDVCNRSNLLECKIIQLNDEGSNSSMLRQRQDPRVKSIKLTSDSDRGDDIATLDDPLSWFYA